MKRFIAFAACVAIVATGCHRQEETAAVKETVAVKVSQPVRQTYNPSIRFSGTACAFKEADLGSTLPGKVEKMNVREGMEVQKGQVLAELSGELLTQAIIENNALKKDYDRLRRLGEKGSMSQIEIDHIKAQYEASQAKVELLKKSTEIVAPFSGTVVDILVEEGENYSLVPSVDQQNMSISNGIIKLMQLNPLVVKIEVNEKDLARIKTGQEATLTFDGCPGETFTGKIFYIRPVLSSSSRSATVEIHVNNAKHTLKPGMFANVSILLPEAEGIFLPLTAIERQAGTSQDYVFVVQGNTARRVMVKRLETINDQAAVEGVTPDQQVIVSGKGKLVDGSVIEIQNK